MFYNSHSKIFAAYSLDGYSWKKLGGIGVKGADVDAFYTEDGNIRVYFGDFSEQTSGVVYTGILKEVKERTTSSEVMDAPGENVQPLGGNKPPPLHLVLVNLLRIQICHKSAKCGLKSNKIRITEMDKIVGVSGYGDNRSIILVINGCSVSTVSPVSAETNAVVETFTGIKPNSLCDFVPLTL